MEKVTVALTTYNRAHMVKKALDSILAQTCKDMKILVVDNGSTDNTQDVLKSFSDPRICLLRNEKNVSSIKREILMSCQTEYLVMTHDDDWLAPEMVERELAVMESDKDIIITSTGADYYAGDGETFLFTSFTKESHLFDKYEYFNYLCKGGRCENIIITPSVMFRVKECKKIDYSFMDRKNFLPSDVYWWLSLNKQGKVYVSNEKLFRSREHQNQATSNKVKLFTDLAEGIGDYIKPHVTEQERDNFVSYYYAKIQIYKTQQLMASRAQEICGGDYSDLKKQLTETQIPLNCEKEFYFAKEEILEKFLQNIIYLKDKYKDEPVNYVLWGASGCGLNTADLLSVYLPNFKQVLFIDKYKKGELNGIPIVSPDEYDFQGNKGKSLIFITTIEGAYDIVRFFNDIGITALNDYNLGYFLYE